MSAPTRTTRDTAARPPRDTARSADRTDAGPYPHNVRAAHCIVDALAAGGVRHAVLSPGSRNTPLALAFDEHSAIATYVVLDERAAGFVALGIGRATGAPAVMCCTSGTAGANYLPAVIEASEARVPLIAITADRPPELQACGAPQTTAQRDLLSSHARWQLTLPVPDSNVPLAWLRNSIAQAVIRASGSPAGPVHLNVPFREPLYDPSVASAPVPPLEPVRTWKGEAMLTDDALHALADELRGESEGVIVCGPLAPATLDAEALADAVADLAAALGWPIVADALSGLRFGRHDRSMVVPTADALLRHPHISDPLRPSRVLCVGQLPTSKPLFQWLQRAAANRVTLLDGDGWWLDGGGCANQLIVAHATTLCRQLVRALRGHDPPETQLKYTLRWLRADAVAQRAITRACSEGLWEGAIARTVTGAMPRGGLLHVANSMPVRDLDSFAAGGTKNFTVQANRGCNGIDGTLSTALGAALAWDRPVVALIGDLAWLHDLSGLEAEANLDVSLTTVVVNNGGGGIFDKLPIAKHPHAFERLFLTPRAASIGMLCEAAGIVHDRVNSTKELRTLLDEHIGGPGSSVIEVVVDRAMSTARRRAAFDSVAIALAHGPSAGPQ